MANPQHIEWLLEGVEAWNARREREPFTPDLSGEDIWLSFFSSGKTRAFGRYDLQGINFRGAILTGASLVEANLKDSDLREADLREANLSRAVLRGADVSSIRYQWETDSNTTIESIGYTDFGELSLITQYQLELMNGDSDTRIPDYLSRPQHWPLASKLEVLLEVSSVENVPTIAEQRFLNITAPVDLQWTPEGHLNVGWLEVTEPKPKTTLPPVNTSTQIEKLSAIGRFAKQVKDSIRKSQTPNSTSIIGDISDVFEAIENEVHKPEGQVLIVVVEANIHALELISVHKEVLTVVDQALFTAFLGTAKSLLDLYPILKEIENPHHADLVPESAVLEATDAMNHVIEVLTSDETVTSLGPRLAGVTKDLAAYPWDSERKKIAVFAAYGVRIKEALESPPKWVTGTQGYATIIAAIVGLLALL